MNLATEYDRWHQKVFESDPEHADEIAPWYDLVLEYLIPVEGKRVLEMACGRGGFSRLLASRGAAMYGADFSGAALQIATRKNASSERRATGAEFTQADAQRLPFASESFDLVVSCETIEHLSDPQAALREMARVCRRGGLLYLTTPNYFNATGLYHIYARMRRSNSTPGSDQPFDRVFLFPQVRRMVQRAGWKIVRTDGTVHQFPVWRGRNPGVVRWLESNRFARWILSPLAFHYFLLAKRSGDC